MHEHMGTSSTGSRYQGYIFWEHCADALGRHHRETQKAPLKLDKQPMHPCWMRRWLCKAVRLVRANGRLAFEIFACYQVQVWAALFVSSAGAADTDFHHGGLIVNICGFTKFYFKWSCYVLHSLASHENGEIHSFELAFMGLHSVYLLIALNFSWSVQVWARIVVLQTLHRVLWNMSCVHEKCFVGIVLVAKYAMEYFYKAS